MNWIVRSIAAATKRARRRPRASGSVRSLRGSRSSAGLRTPSPIEPRSFRGRTHRLVARARRPARRRQEPPGTPRGDAGSELRPSLPATAADLAVARRSFPGDPTVAALEQRVGRPGISCTGRRRDANRSSSSSGAATGRPCGSGRSFSRSPPRSCSAPRSSRASGPTAIPARPRASCPPATRASRSPGRTAPTSASRGARAARSPRRSSRTTSRSRFYEFALGITAGLGTAAIILFNGIQFGAVGGLAIGSGNGPCSSSSSPRTGCSSSRA